MIRRVALAVWAAAAATPLSAQQVPARLEHFLRASIGLDSAQVRRVARGEAVVKVLPTPIKRDVAVFGIIPVDVPRTVYVERVLHTATWLRAANRPHVGVFSDPAQPADVRDVTIDQDDVHDLKNCRPDHCKLKLPASEMQRIRQDIDWSVSDPDSQVDAYASERMLAYVTAYRAHGDSALHFFEAVFDLTLAVDRPTASGTPGMYLVVIRRYRFDNLPGGIFNIRGKVIGKLRDKMLRDLQHEKHVSEQASGSGEKLPAPAPRFETGR